MKVAWTGWSALRDSLEGLAEVGSGSIVQHLRASSFHGFCFFPSVGSPCASNHRKARSVDKK